MKSKALAIPRESSFPLLSLISSFLMFLTFFFYFQSVNGQVQAGITTPIAANGNDVITLFFNVLSSSIPVVLFIVTLCYAKRDLSKLLLPTAMMPVTYLLYEIYSVFHQYGSFILHQWFRVSISLAILLLCYLTFNKKMIKSKWPLILTCLIGMAVSILFTVYGVYPFAMTYEKAMIGQTAYDHVTVTYPSVLIQFCAYLGAILFLALALTPGGKYKVSSSRKFFRLKHIDEIHAISISHRKK